MKKNIILIDYENVQKIDLKPLLEHDVIIKVFHDEFQKFSSAFTNLAIELGKDKIQLIKISGSGKNAADFHIAYEMGKLTKEIPAPVFHIISNDTGFKPLVNHVKIHDNICCLQETEISTLSLVKAPESTAKKSHFQEVFDYISNYKIPRPKTMKSLRNQILSICHRELSDQQVDEIIHKLISKKVIFQKDESISYPACV